eukprot:CAMPEP_0197555330 /NCGR_PEP_ID=MMETSP1320-20131121/13104_1 /TAXON_ID=91990 /ORGANISM="Bolidomonas sp., Strain RCC2347" /LENGTH=1008 /DNA_ID=CAMNT_0043116337 /DNA_START=42 /DNA_END=3065 /DNA_ORIENTATION=-
MSPGSSSQHKARTVAASAAKQSQALAAIHARMRQQEPTIAELSAPTSGRQPKNGGLSTKEVIAARLAEREAAKARKVDGEGKSVAETLAWVRAKSAERRSRKLLAHFAGAEGKENEMGPSLVTSQPVKEVEPMDVAASIARGQQILKDAEGNMTAFEKYMQDMKAGKANSKPKDEEQEELDDRGAGEDGGDEKSSPRASFTSKSTPVSPERDKSQFVLKNARSNSNSKLVYQKMATVPFDPEAFRGSAMSDRLQNKFKEMVPTVNLDDGPEEPAYEQDQDPYYARHPVKRRSKSSPRPRPMSSGEGREEEEEEPTSTGPRHGNAKVTVLPSKKTQESMEEEEMLKQMVKVKEDARRRTIFQARQKEAELKAKMQADEVLEEYQKRREVDFEILIREGEEIKRLEEEAAERKRRGGRAATKGEDASKDKDKDKDKEKPFAPAFVQPFDPSTLEGVKRAKQAAEKREQDIQEAELVAAEKRKFKARPLPGGVQVQSNLHAKTEAAKAKEKRLRRGTRGSAGRQRPSGPMRLDAAALFRQLDAGVDVRDEVEEVVAAPTLSADEIARRKEDRKQKRMKEKMARDQAGIASLQEEIAKLEEKLGKGKFSKQVDKNDDDDDDYLDAIDGAGEMLKRQYDGEQGSSTDSDDDDDEERLAPRTNRPATFLTGMDIAEADGSDDDSSSCSSASSVSSGDDEDLKLVVEPPPAKVESSGPSSEVYRRQEKWLAEKERKRTALIAEKEKKALEGFTGKPELGSAKESWARAKAAHNAAVEKAKAMEDARVKEKEDKERAEARRKLREIDGLKAQVRYKKKLRRMKIDKDKQRESLEKLSKPKNAKSVSAELGIKDESDLELHRAKEKLKEAAGGDVGNEKGSLDVGGDDGFGDMDEKQYIKVMKALGLDPGITAKKKKKKKKEGGKNVDPEIMKIDIGPLELDDVDGKGGGAVGSLSDQPDSLVNLGSVSRPPPASSAAQPDPSPSAADAGQGMRTDFRRADFVNDTSVMKEIDDVFA